MGRDFEDHCWKDIVDDEILEIYEPYRRDTFVGRNPAVLAIDLYNKAYQGGNRPVREVNQRFEGSCGENAWRALEPTRALLAAALKKAFEAALKDPELLAEADKQGLSIEPILADEAESIIRRARSISSGRSP